MRSIFLTSALLIGLGMTLPAYAVPVSSDASSSMTEQVKVKKHMTKKQRMMMQKKQMGNDTMNSSSGMNSTDGGRGGKPASTGGM